MARIWVIDDSPSTLATIESMFAEAGHEVHTSTNGKGALQMIEHDSYDLLLTDIYMPDQDGLEVIRKVRRLRPNLPVVAMSGMTGALSMLRVAKLLGACRLLKKPFSKVDLLAAVEAALDQRSRPAAIGDRTTPASPITGVQE